MRTTAPKALLVAATMMILLLQSAALHAAVVDVKLRASAGSVTMPGGRTIPIWGFSQYSTATLTAPTLPGPTITVAGGDTVRFTIRNDLPVPVSLMIPGQLFTPPAKILDATAGTGLPAKSRVRSFNAEVAPGQELAAVATFTSVKPGTYLYQSGTNPAVQIPMGLYGAFVVTSGTAGQTYPTDPAKAASAFDHEPPPVLFSEILGRYDTTLTPPGYIALNEDVAAAPTAPRSTVDYRPFYHLINGKAYPQTADIDAPAAVAPALTSKSLFRMLNAGSRDVVPSVLGNYFSIIAEDGNLLTYARQEHSPILPAGKTLDALLVRGAAKGFFPLFDRRLGIDNAGASIGGMMTFLGDTACSPIKGDIVGNDGRITYSDVLALLRAYLDGGSVPAADVWPLDVSGLPCGDGATTLMDVMFVLQKAAGRNPY